jgi:hypothetical protein
MALWDKWVSIQLVSYDKTYPMMQLVSMATIPGVNKGD